MQAQIIDGRKIAADIRSSVAQDVISFRERTGRAPCLAVVLVGEDPASKVYVRMKEKNAQEVGIRSIKIELPLDTTESQLLEVVGQLGDDTEVDAILVQLPLPPHISEQKIIETVPPDKDVDGFHPVNAGHLLAGSGEGFVPCTPAGVIELIRKTGTDIAGKEAVVVGRSLIVGKPVSQLLLAENATVTVAHSRTADLKAVCKRADILVVAIGKPRLITKDFVKPGAVVIDVGVNRLSDGKLAGDVDYDEVLGVAGHLTPVPGGVGPMTIAMLMKNTMHAAIRHRKLIDL